VTQSQEEKNIAHTTKRGKVSWTGEILSGYWLLKDVTAGRTEVTRRRGTNY